MPKALLIRNGKLRNFACTFVTSSPQIYRLRFLPDGATFRVRSTFRTCFPDRPLKEWLSENKFIATYVSLFVPPLYRSWSCGWKTLRYQFFPTTKRSLLQRCIFWSPCSQLFYDTCDVVSVRFIRTQTFISVDLSRRYFTIRVMQGDQQCCVLTVTWCRAAWGSNKLEPSLQQWQLKNINSETKAIVLNVL